MKNTNKGNKKIMTVLAAMAAVTTMCATAAVFTASASPIYSTSKDSVAAAAAEAKAEDANAYGKHPGESGFCYFQNQKA